MSNTTSKRMRPARTLEAREQQMTALAVDLAEERLRNGTASAQEICFFLKLATVQAQMDKEEQRARIDLMNAKKKAIESSELQEGFYAEVIDAVRGYQGRTDDNEGTNPNLQ